MIDFRLVFLDYVRLLITDYILFFCFSCVSIFAHLVLEVQTVTNPCAHLNDAMVPRRVETQAMSACGKHSAWYNALELFQEMLSSLAHTTFGMTWGMRGCFDTGMSMRIV